MERTIAKLKRASVAITVLTVLVSSAFLYQSRQARAMKDLASQNYDLARRSQIAEKGGRERLLQLQISTGLRLMESDDLAGSLQWFAEALKNLHGDTNRESIHRMRIASVLDQQPKLAALLTRTSAVVSAEFSPDGRRIVIGTRGGAGCVYDLESRRVLFDFEEPARDPHVSFSKDGERLVIDYSTNQLGSCVLVDATNGKRLLVPGEAEGTRFVATHDGRTVLACADDQALQLFDARTGKVLSPRITAAGQILTAYFSRDGNRVALLTRAKGLGESNTERHLQVWSLADARPLANPINLKDVSFYALDEHGNRLFVVWKLSMNTVLEVFDTTTNSLAAPTMRVGGLDVAAVSQDGNLLLKTVFGDPEAHLWDTQTGKDTGILQHSGRLRHAAFSPDQLLVATTSEDGTARVWNAFTREPMGPPLRHASYVLTAAFSPDGRFLLTGGEDRTVRVWDLATARQPEEIFQKPQITVSASLSPDGRKIATVGASYRIADRVTRAVVYGSEPEDQIWGKAAFSPDGERLLIWNGSRYFYRPNSRFDAAKGAILCDPTTARLLMPRLAPETIVVDAAFSPDGKRVLTASEDKTARIWDATTGKELIPPIVHSNRVEAACFSPDGRLIATACGGFLGVWDANSGQLRREISRTDEGWGSVEFSPDGSLLAAGGGQIAQVWSVGTGRAVAGPFLHGGPVWAVRFNPQGSLLMTYGVTGRLQVWDVLANKVHLTPIELGSHIWKAGFSTDGRLGIACGEKGTLCIWESTTGDQILRTAERRDSLMYADFAPSGDAFVWIDQMSDIQWARLGDCSLGQGDVAILGQVYRGSKLNEIGSFVPLTAEEMLAHYQRLGQSGTTLFQVTPEQVLLWHKRMAQEAVVVACHPASTWHSSRVLAAEPEQRDMLTVRAHARAEIGEWAGAEEDFRRAWTAGLRDQDTFVGAELCALAGTGDATAFRAECQKQWEIFPRDQVVSEAVLVPDALPSVALALEATERVAAQSPEQAGMFGCVLFRAGRFEAALEQLQKDRALKGDQDVEIPVSLLFLAMTYHHLGNLQQAEDHLSLAKESVRRKPLRRILDGRFANGATWALRLRYDILLKETEKTLQR
jgi:WD40 repeat protein/tetratricopeptide (TPR) repeat protein